MGRHWVVLSLGIAGVLTASGCGGAKPAAAPPPPRLTQAQFVARANAVCREGARNVRPGLQHFRRALRRKNFEQLSLSIGELVQPYGRYVFRLSRLHPPLRRAGAFRELIRLEQREHAYFRALYRVTATYEFAKVQVLTRRLDRANARAVRVGRALGLGRVCYR